MLPRLPTVALLLLLLLGAAWSQSCSLKQDTLVAVYSDTSGGVGPGSSAWEEAFWSWWGASDARLKYLCLLLPSALSPLLPSPFAT